MSEPIKCGVAFFPPNWIDLAAAVYAEELGFDALWIGEHIVFHIPTFDALTAMAAVAACTTTIGIGVSAVLLPLRPAAAVAKCAHVYPDAASHVPRRIPPTACHLCH